MRHIISVLVENEFGALARIAGLFSARGYNIESLNVAPTQDGSMSRMTIVTSGTDEIIEQITKQLNKLVDVIKLTDLTESSHIEREVMLVKINAAGAERRDEVKRLTDIFRGKVLDVTDTTFTVEVTGAAEKLDAFVDAIGYEGLIEVVRSGPMGIGRGEKPLQL
ncbi:acetolactate synthase, small subunit [gamma proteobacterium HTCC5015]|nr:acetolactate synthase, small subunit [gamma proteobacterium HTCC5015]